MNTFWTHAFALGWRNLWRDLRAGELRLLMVALLLAVAAISSVGFFADRLNRGLVRDARQLIGGDAVLVADNPLAPVFEQQARAYGLQTAHTLGFPTMGRAAVADGGATRLVALKAVAAGYPLRGQLKVGASPQDAGALTRAVPAPGDAWVDAAVLDALGLQVGGKLLLGEATLRIARIIVTEPDRGAGFMSFAPRVLINQADLARSALVQPASRVTYRMAVAGADAQVKAFSQWAEQDIKRNERRGLRLESFESGRPEMRQTLDRASQFLNLVALLTALLSAVAVAMAARGFASRHLDDCAMLRVLGQSQRSIALSYGLECLLVGAVASGLGAALGYGAHYLFVWLLAGLLDTALPAPSLQPLAMGLGMGLTLLAAFGLPPVLQLAQVPPLRVIRRDLGGLRPASWAVLALGMGGFGVLLLAVAGDLKLGAIAVAGFAGAVLLFAALSYLALRLLRRSVNEARAPRWLVLATRQITARPAVAVVQVSALAVGLLALILLVLLRTDLIGAWRRATPPDAPNRFVINVMPEQASAFRHSLEAAGVQHYDWYPMMRARLVAVNGRSVSPDDYTEERAKRLVDREFNLSFSAQAPPHNRVLAGRWTPEEAGAISVEDGLATALHLQLGDVLRFDSGGLSSEARITSLRKVDWTSLRANFFAMYPVSRMDSLPVTYMSAFRAPTGPTLDRELVQTFPNITAVDMSQTLGQIHGVLDQVIRAVEFLFGFALAAGLVVLFATVAATREERARDYAIMRALGASARLLRQVQQAELIGVGWLAGLLASTVAMAIGWALAHYVFEFDWTASPGTAVWGGLSGAALAWAAGQFSLRELLARPVVQTLRQAAE